jgi:hypothetical protein
MLAVLAAVLFSVGCAKEPASASKPNPPRRMLKPGDKPELAKRAPR